MALRCGIVGLNSRIERVVIAGLRASGEADVVGVCSRDQVKGRRVAGEIGARYYRDYDEMVKSVDAVFVCTPPDAHRTYVEQAAAAGTAVMCEKPLALTLADAVAIVEAVERAGIRTAVNFTYRSGAYHRLVDRLLRTTELGPLLHVSIDYLQDRGLDMSRQQRDALIEIAPHAVDLSRWWSGAAGAGDIVSVVAQAGPTGEARRAAGASESIGLVYQALVSFSSGATGSITVSRIASGHGNAVLARLDCRDGAIALAFDTEAGDVRLARGREASWQTIEIPADLAVSYTDFPAHHFGRIARALTGRETFPTIRDGLAVQRVMDAITRSVASGARVEIAAACKVDA